MCLTSGLLAALQSMRSRQQPVCLFPEARKPVGLVNARLVLSNPRRPDLQPVEVEALADSEAVQLWIPPHVRIELQLEKIEKKRSHTCGQRQETGSLRGTA